jgi:hypothetical protein
VAFIECHALAALVSTQVLTCFASRIRRRAPNPAAVPVA